MKQTMSRTIDLLLICFLLMFCLTSRATATPPPCPDCYYWDSGEEACVPYGDCWGGCPSCESCVNCYCYCTSECCEDSHCSGCCTCSGCSCVDNDANCSQENCYDCNDCGCEYRCDPNNCEICVDGSCVDRCTLDPNSCDICDGKGNCFSTCDPNCEFCCGGTCINNYECCIDDTCVDPMCDNCHTFSDTLYECNHLDYDPNGTPCSTTECIINVLDTVTCDYKGDEWPCRKSRCDVSFLYPLEKGEVIQIISDTTCAGGTVDWQTWYKIYEGCVGCWLNLGTKACEVSWCDFNPIPGRGGFRGYKKECGACGYCD